MRYKRCKAKPAAAAAAWLLLVMPHELSIIGI